MEEKHAIILFDGVCNLCNGLVAFVIKRDKKGYFKFGSVQSDASQKLLDRFPHTDVSGFDSVVLIENNRLYIRADAGLRIMSRLNAPWNWLRIGFVFPKFLRDAVYDFIARYRYAWFGKRDECMIPDPAYADRFID